MAGKKHTALLTMTAVLLCFAVLGAFLFIAACAPHKCEHDGHCEICRMIDVSIHFVRGEPGVTTLAVISVLAAAAAAAAVCRAITFSHTTTLIHLRTELRN